VTKLYLETPLGVVPLRRNINNSNSNSNKVILTLVITITSSSNLVAYRLRESTLE
jgi:hypothetical protein